MTIRLALFALAVGLWSCGDNNSSAPTAAVVDPMIATADSMLVVSNTMLATANTMIAADAASMLSAADSMLATAGSLLAPEAVLRPTGQLKPWDLSPIVSVDEVRTMPVGTTVFMRTEFAHGELADLEMTFVQVVDDFLAPMPVYMVESSDPVLIQLGGIAKGMSGSPIFTEQGTWGAIAYGFSAQDNPPYYFFATPIEWVIGTRGMMPAAKRTATWEGNRITPLEIPLLSTGLNGVHPLPERRSSLLSGASAAGLTQERQESFEAGRPLAVGLLLGELTLGSLGTISYVDGNRIYGFGHPMSGSGPVALPIIEAKVLGEISNLSAPFKFATLNPTVRGILTEDRLPAVRGVLGEQPRLIPIRSVYAFPSGSELELTHRMAAVGSYTASALISNAFFVPLANRVDNDPNYSIRVATGISFAGTYSAALTRSRLYSTPGGQLMASISAAYDDVSLALEELMTRSDHAVYVRGAGVHVEVIPETRFATVMQVAADEVISLGSTLDITTSLRVGRYRDQKVELALSVPDTLLPGFYQLEVGSAAELGPDALSFVPPPGPPEGEETLDDIFARLNKPDENIFLKARLSFVAPPRPEPPPELEGGEGASEGGPEGGEDEDGESEGHFDELPPSRSLRPSPPPSPPVPISTQEDVDLVLQGIQTLDIEVVAGNQ